MRIFCDTNIVTEIIESRQFAPQIIQILRMSSGRNEFYVSAGGFYTVTYLAERFLKKRGLHNPMRVQETRKALKGLLCYFRIAANDAFTIEEGLDDDAFTDLEDSYQYQAALACHADILLTINVKDFKNVEQRPLQVMTPTEFVERYL